MENLEEGHCNFLMSTQGIQASALKTSGQLCGIGMFGVILCSQGLRLRSTKVLVVVVLSLFGGCLFVVCLVVGGGVFDDSDVDDD